MKTEQKCKIRMGEKSETNSVIFYGVIKTIP